MKLTPAQKQLKKGLIQAIHLSKRYINYYKDNKEEYKKLLMDNFGVDTSTKLTINQLIVLKDYLNFKRDSLSNFKEKATPSQIKLLRELWQDYARDTSDRALIWFLKKYEGRLVINIEQISKKAAQKAIIALKKSTPRNVKW